MTLLEGSVGVEDLVLLEPLEQESLIRNLQLRYEKKEIYVSAHGCPRLWMCGQRVPGSFPDPPWLIHHLPQLQTYIGSVLVSVNPYQPLPIYDLEFVTKYRDYTFYELKPHM